MHVNRKKDLEERYRLYRLKEIKSMLVAQSASNSPIRSNRNSPLRLYEQNKQHRLKRDAIRINIEKSWKEMLRSPQISPKSQLLALKHAEVNIANRLLLSGKAKEMRQNLEIQKSHEEARRNASLKISKASSKLSRLGPIEERLMRYKEKYLNNTIKKREEAIPNFPFKPQMYDNRALCSPVELTAQSSGFASFKNLEIQDFTYSPAINKRSRNLAKWRSASPPRSKQCTCSCEEFNFKPSINTKSQELDKRKNDSNPRCKILHDLNTAIKSKLQTKRDYYKKQERFNIECAFSPKTKCCNISRSSSPISTANRLTKWLSEKELKLKEVKDQLKDKCISDCTFKPVINEPSPLSSISKPEPKNLQDYLKRQDIIRRIKSGEKGTTEPEAVLPTLS